LQNNLVYTFRTYGVELANVLSNPKFLNGVGAIWNLDEFKTPTQPKYVFALARECELTSLPLPPT